MEVLWKCWSWLIFMGNNLLLLYFLMEDFFFVLANVTLRPVLQTGNATRLKPHRKIIQWSAHVDYVLDSLYPRVSILPFLEHEEGKKREHGDEVVC